MIGIISGRGQTVCLSALMVAGALVSPMLSDATLAQAPQNSDVSSIHARHPRTIASVSVGPDQALVYPADLPGLPDEHTTFVPSALGSNVYLVFAASRKGEGPDGAVVLQTSNLKSFTYAAKYQSPVMVPPIKFMTCKSTYDAEFDLNYSGPGSVVQDPTRPPGHMIMIYQAENHCPGGKWQRQFYATVGFARSTDFGKTWPIPIAGELGGKDRRPILKMPVPQPKTPPTSPIYMGNALPSAFVDEANPKGEHYIYVIYLFVGQLAGGYLGDGYLRVARAKLDDDELKLDRPDRWVTFTKWYNGAFSQQGIGGLDSGVTPGRGCAGGQQSGQISYNDAIDQYLLTFVCVSLQGQPGNMKAYQAAWYYSTATSLDLQNWTTPQLIHNSEFPVTTGCAFDGSGRSFDGWYPSFMSPDHPAGHLGETGQVFFMNGCETGKRRFMSRAFSIAIAPN
jgi:hypothetical protein